MRVLTPVQVAYLAQVKRTVDAEWAKAVALVAQEQGVPEGVAVTLVAQDDAVRMVWEASGDIKSEAGPVDPAV